LNSPLYSVARPSASPDPKGLLVLLHGLGSDEEDLIGLAEYLDPAFYVSSLRGPLSYGPGYMWFTLDVTGGSIRYDVSEARRSIALVSDQVRSLQDQVKLGPNETVVAGFSQGAMLSLGLLCAETDLATRFWLMSGASIPELELGLRGKNPSVLIQHGLYDEVVPVSRGRRTRDLLLGAGLKDVQYLEYPMAHSISQEGLKDANRWLSTMAL
jgi:phospholipase/carboxylesterase